MDSEAKLDVSQSDTTDCSTLIEPISQTLLGPDLIRGKVVLNTGSEELVVHMLDRTKFNSVEISELKKTSDVKKLQVTPSIIDEKVPKFGSADYCSENVNNRKQWLEKKTDTDLLHVGGVPVPTEVWKGNIENLIGTIQIPLGICGPLLVKGEHADGTFYVPMATTEGAIITTYSTGMRLVTQSGGVNVSVQDNFSHVSPMFRVKNLAEAKEFQVWLNKQFSVIKEVAESTTSHGELRDIKSYYWDRRVVVQFNYYTADAQGMNMVNVATEKACDYIFKETGKSFNVRSNFSAVKKMSIHNVFPTFGKSVRAEALVTKKELSKLKVRAKDVASTWHDGLSVTMKSGTIGINCQAANCIASVFLACGQDIADISSSHVAYSNFLETEEDLYVEVYIPSLSIGTVGGGTGKGSQNECLRILDCYGNGKVLKFAEIIGAAVLAGELATVCAITNGTFVQAHAALGRNKPI